MNLINHLGQTTVVGTLTSPEYFPFWTFMAFFYGALIGSFLNVCILRLPLGMSVFKPKRSFCFRCGTQIPWYDNLPILSYFILGGKDRACGAKFSPRYMLIELMTGIIFVVIFLMWNEPGNFSMMTLWYAGFSSLLIIGIFTDLDHWINLDYLTRWGTGAAVLFALAAGFFDRDSMIALSGPFPYIRIEAADWIERVMYVLVGRGYDWQQLPEALWWEPVANSIIGMLFAPGLVVGVSKGWELITGREGMGLGDAEIFALIGATIGAQNSLVAFVFASFIGAAMGITKYAVMASKGNKEGWDKSPLRLGRWKDENRIQAEQIESQESKFSTVGELPETTEEELAQAKALAESLGEKFINLDSAEISQDLIDAFPARLAIDQLVLPLYKKGKGEKAKWVIAVTNPLSTSLINAIRSELKLEAEFRIAAESQLIQKTEEFFGQRYDDPASSENSSENAAQEFRNRNRAVWQKYNRIASVIPPEKSLGSIPFIPSIAGGSFIILLAYPWVLALLRSIFVVEIYP